jgi:hypothetical protein
MHVLDLDPSCGVHALTPHFTPHLLADQHNCFIMIRERVGSNRTSMIVGIIWYDRYSAV